MKKTLHFVPIFSVLVFGFAVPSALAAISGPNNPTTAVNDSSTGAGTISWSPITSLFTIDGTNSASVSLDKNKTTKYLKFTGLNLSVPTGAIINGITVDVTRRTTATNAIKDSVVELITTNATTTSKADTGIFWPTTFGSKSYGGSADTWGRTWTPAEINSTSFGLIISAENVDNTSSRTVYIDGITITVAYSSKSDQTITVTTHTPASAIYNSTFDVAASASSGLDVAITTTGGCSGSGTGSATVTMTSGTDACVVHYNQAGNASYNAAPEVTETATANKKNPTISVTNSPVVYDGSSHSAMVIGSVEGTPSNISTGSSATQTDIGTYAVTADFSPTDSANYNSLTGASAGNFVISAAQAAVSSVASISDIHVANGTTFDAVSLPTTVSVALNDASNHDLAVTWDGGSPVFNGAIAGTYVFAGTLTLPDGVTNSDDQKAHVNVIVAAMATHTLTYTAGANGSITGDSPQTVNAGADGTTVTAVPDFGYHFTSWSDGVLTTSRTDTSVQATVSVTADFAVNAHIITASVGEHGAITPAGESGVAEGGSQSFTITPAEGYHVADVLVDSVSVGAVSSYDFTGVTGDHTISATFALNATKIVSIGEGSNTTTSTTAGDVAVSIPASTNVTGPVDWNGDIAAPAVTTVTLPTTSGQTKTLSTAIELGFVSAKLSFDKAVRILLPNQVGKRAGYVRPGIDFTEITNTCSADDQATMNTELAADSECKKDVGADMVIWTKHFTTFATYTQTATPSPTQTSSNVSVGGGGRAISVAPVATALPANEQGHVLGAAVFNFANDLTIGSRGADVTALQQFFIDNGYSIPAGATGNFGAQTRAVVIAFQKARGIAQTGFVGQLTRAELNKGSMGSHLTATQVDAIISVLQSFGVDPSVIAKVKASLGQ